MFDIVISVQIILAVVLGGRGTLWGPVLGAAIIEPLNELANQQFGGGNSRLLIFGGLLALTILLLPKGIIPSVRELLERRAKRGQRGAGRRLAWARARPLNGGATGARPTERRDAARGQGPAARASRACGRSTAARSRSSGARSPA